MVSLSCSLLHFHLISFFPLYHYTCTFEKIHIVSFFSFPSRNKVNFLKVYINWSENSNDAYENRTKANACKMFRLFKENCTYVKFDAVRYTAISRGLTLLTWTRPSLVLMGWTILNFDKEENWTTCPRSERSAHWSHNSMASPCHFEMQTTILLLTEWILGDGKMEKEDWMTVPRSRERSAFRVGSFVNAEG